MGSVPATRGRGSHRGALRLLPRDRGRRIGVPAGVKPRVAPPLPPSKAGPPSLVTRKRPPRIQKVPCPEGMSHELVCSVAAFHAPFRKTRLKRRRNGRIMLLHAASARPERGVHHLPRGPLGIASNRAIQQGKGSHMPALPISTSTICVEHKWG